MGFVSMNEVLKKKMKVTSGRSIKYNLLALSCPKSIGKGTQYDRVMAIHITPLLMQRTGFKDGDKLDFQFDYKNREGVLMLASEGGRTLGGGIVKGVYREKAVRRVAFPYFPGFGFPQAKNGTVTIPDDRIHFSNLRVVFKLNGMDDKFNYHLEER